MKKQFSKSGVLLEKFLKQNVRSISNVHYSQTTVAKREEVSVGCLD